MITINQLLSSKGRSKKIKLNKVPALLEKPQAKGICLKVFTRKPKKPNSAIRKLAKLKLSTKKTVDCYIPGIGHNLRQFSSVLIRGGKTQDMPGIKYKCVRGVLDFNGLIDRKTSRSQYGTKRNIKL